VANTAELEQLQTALAIRFRQPELLDLALTHRSCGERNNERLEFLGDSILNHVIAEWLYHGFPDASEGELSRMRAALVRRETLAGIARELDLGDWIRLGTGELKSGGGRRASILADALEAVVGATLLDAGPLVTKERVLDWYGSRLRSVSPEATGKDAKTRLQEYLQGRGLALPEYRLRRVEGADHLQEFHVECVIEELSLAFPGSGSSRRRAEQAAAASALESVDA
jgi:ribonuclease-3